MVVKTPAAATPAPRKTNHRVPAPNTGTRKTPKAKDVAATPTTIQSKKRKRVVEPEIVDDDEEDDEEQNPEQDEGEEQDDEDEGLDGDLLMQGPDDAENDEMLSKAAKKQLSLAPKRYGHSIIALITWGRC